MATITEILKKRKELDELEQEYLDETPACNNKKCSFYRKEYRFGKCTWSVLLEDCKDYIPI